ncbi:hypothetical protein [Halarchaeum nitratireducens]|uniref:Uncharacterized protein n=1 Tax=Halarchaeum nitratireducens TaxID=489913 RepID=A0A830GBI2_9EURY|nr:MULTISPECIES: hypothetical protein [Halarchaeum]MBP2250637.1 hypothetical protein [Halarchaeum solikamskense]GGN15821.1 hypothetical protein GCM10009021_15330 [Halarchaeum nitratireducens]
MGIIEFHVHDGLSFEAEFGDESSGDVGIAPVDGEETDEVDGAGVGCGRGESKALGLFVVLGFLVVTGLLVKRKLGGAATDTEI